MKSSASAIAGVIFTLLLPPLNAQSQAQTRSERANLTRSTTGFTYFNRPGATIAAHDDAVRMCVSRSNALPQFTDGQVFQGLVPDLIAGFQDDARLKANLENCMVVAGWRVVRLPSQEGPTLSETTGAFRTIERLDRPGPTARNHRPNVRKRGRPRRHSMGRHAEWRRHYPQPKGRRSFLSTASVTRSGSVSP